MKKKQIIILILILFVVFLIGYFFRNVSTNPAFDRNVSTGTSEKSQGTLMIISEPTGAQIFINDKYSGQTTPASLGLVDGDFIQLKLNGFWIEGQVITSDIIKTGQVSYSLKRAPTTNELYKDTIGINYTSFLYPDTLKPYLVYYNNQTRIVEINTGENYFALLREQLPRVRDLLWIDAQKAYVTTGEQLDNLRIFSLDLSPWQSKSTPVLRELSIKGWVQDYNPQLKQLLYQTNINFLNATSTLSIYDTDTGVTTELSTEILAGLYKAVLGNQNKIVVIEQPSDVGNLGNEYYIISSLEKTTFSWDKKNIDTSPLSYIKTNPSREDILYFNGNNWVIYNLTNNTRTSVNIFNKNIPLTELVPAFIQDKVVSFSGINPQTRTLDIIVIDLETGISRSYSFNVELQGKVSDVYYSGNSLINTFTLGGAYLIEY